MTVLTDAALRAAIWIADVAPTPTPSGPGAFVGDEDTITPTWVGFVATFGVAIITVLLVIDMTRRVRRVRYRGEIRERLEAEAAEGGGVDLAPGVDPTLPGPPRPRP